MIRLLVRAGRDLLHDLTHEHHHAAEAGGVTRTCVNRRTGAVAKFWSPAGAEPCFTRVGAA